MGAAWDKDTGVVEEWDMVVAEVLDSAEDVGGGNNILKSPPASGVESLKNKRGGSSYSCFSFSLHDY